VSKTLRILVVLSVLVALPALASAEVFHSKESALKAAFPSATKVEEKSIYLSSDDSSWIRSAAGVEWPSRVARAYIAYKGSSILAYGFIDTHRVRSLDQTVMVVLDPAGSVKRTFLLAFHEPAEYMASPRWWAQFKGHRLDEKLSLRKDIDGISGATMSARAGVAMTRRVLALFERKLSRSALASRQ
jgi:hypothetical protein